MNRRAWTLAAALVLLGPIWLTPALTRSIRRVANPGQATYRNRPSLHRKGLKSPPGGVALASYVSTDAHVGAKLESPRNLASSTTVTWEPTIEYSVHAGLVLYAL